MNYLAKILFAGSCAVTTWAQAGTVSPADNQAGAAIINRPAEIRLGFEQITFPGDEAVGMVGAGYLIQGAPGIYLGPAVYGAITGRRGGLFTVGGELAWHQHLVSGLEMQAGVYGGGGGGAGASSAGGGLMIRPHVDMLWDFGGYHAGISASNVRYPNGTIDSSQVGLVLSADSDFCYCSPNQIGQQVAVSGRSGVGIDRVLITAGVYRRVSGAATTSNSMGYLGARLEQFYSPSLYRGIEIAGGASGGMDGYAEFLGVLGAETPVWNDHMGVGARVAIGMAGGGGVPVGGGALIKLGAYATVNLSRDTHLTLEGGYANAPDGNFRSTYGEADFVWDLDHPYAPSGQGTIAGNEWLAGSAHYYGTAQQDGAKRPFDAVTIKVNRYLTDVFYLTGQAYSAYSGNAGVHAAGLVGAGYRTRKFADALSAGAELLVGAADTSGGSIVQPMVYLAMDLTDEVGVRLGAGRVKSLKGVLDSDLVDLSLSFAFGTSGR